MKTKNGETIYDKIKYDMILSKRRIMKQKEEKEYIRDKNKLKEKGSKIRKNYIKGNIIRDNNFISIIIIYLILMNLFIKTKNSIYLFNYNQESKISLKIIGIGENAILGNETDHYFNGINYLEKVIINGNEQETIDYRYYFNQTDNYVELIWNDSINTCINMFHNCYSIIEINLSNFDTSLVTSMYRMFSNCSQLTSLDLSNFNTSLVASMGYMFYNCEELKSLDFSYFDTSIVRTMSHMFYFCKNTKNIKYF